MGASGSKKRSTPLRGLQERLLQTGGRDLWGRCNRSGEGSSRFQGESGREQNSPSCEGQRYNPGDFVNTPQRTPAPEGESKLYRQQNMDAIDADDDDLVGVSVRPRVPLRAMTYRMAIDMSHLIKQEGGLEGMFYSERRHRILDMYLENEEGIIPDWQNYTHGPGVRYPKFFGWLWKLVPVDIPQEEEDTETNCLLHPAQTSPFDDPHRERLVWRFDPMLAHEYTAYVKYPEEFGYKSGLPEEEWRARLKARGIPFN
uniref:Protein Nef n=1 Tax=Human immunodeficiency virus 2 TaxID=11709 RepID=Q7ZGK8_9HIV2|nr:nef protein [Human immunodeficiency virus 2]